jgi:hypothetical protein
MADVRKIIDDLLNRVKKGEIKPAETHLIW